MLKSLLVAAIAVTFAASMAFADQTNGKVIVPIKTVAANSGKQMYANYCAPCHGVDGRGRGPVAGALRAQPTDLTVLSRNNRGKFPDTHVVTVLQNGSASHGSVEMPVWGPILGKMNQNNPQDRLLRISNLSQYLDSIQAK